MLDRCLEAFDENMAAPLHNLANASTCPPKNIHFTYTDTNIDLLSEELNIPLELSKMIPFAMFVPYLSFLWDLNAHMAADPTEKKEKYLNVIKEWSQKPDMLWLRSKDSIVSCFTLPWSYLLEEHTSPLWKPCFQVSITVLSCHTPHPTVHPVTSSGGWIFSDHQNSHGQSQDQYPSWTSKHSQT